MCCPSSRAVCVFLSLLGLGLSLYALHVETQVHYLEVFGQGRGQGLKVAMSHAIRKGATRYFSIRSIFLREAFKKM